MALIPAGNATIEGIDTIIRTISNVSAGELNAIVSTIKVPEVITDAYIDDVAAVLRTAVTENMAKYSNIATTLTNDIAPTTKRTYDALTSNQQLVDRVMDRTIGMLKTTKNVELSISNMEGEIKNSISDLTREIQLRNAISSEDIIAVQLVAPPDACNFCLEASQDIDVSYRGAKSGAKLDFAGFHDRCSCSFVEIPTGQKWQKPEYDAIF